MDAALVAAYVALTASGMPLTCANVRNNITTELGEDPEARLLSPRKVSSIAKTLGFRTRHTNHGAVLSIDQKRLKTLCERFSIVRKPA